MGEYNLVLPPTYPQPPVNGSEGQLVFQNNAPQVFTSTSSHPCPSYMTCNSYSTNPNLLNVSILLKMYKFIPTVSFKSKD
jgi:hypothetical protein